MKVVRPARISVRQSGVVGEAEVVLQSSTDGH